MSERNEFIILRVDLTRGETQKFRALKEAFGIKHNTEAVRILIRDAYDKIDIESPLTKAERAYLREWIVIMRGFQAATREEIDEALQELQLTKAWLPAKFQAASDYVWGLKR